MIKDIGTIRKELDGFEEIEEIEIPNAFKKGNHIKYITQKNDEESFYKGGKFNYYGDDCIYLESKSKKWCVPICKRNEDGSIKYQSRFFIKEKEEDKECLEENNKLMDTIKYQQKIIQKLTENLKDVLDICYIYGSGPFLLNIFKLIRSLLDPVTKKKIVIVKQTCKKSNILL